MNLKTGRNHKDFTTFVSFLYGSAFLSLEITHLSGHPTPQLNNDSIKFLLNKGRSTFVFREPIVHDIANATHCRTGLSFHFFYVCLAYKCSGDHLRGQFLA